MEEQKEEYITEYEKSKFVTEFLSGNIKMRIKDELDRKSTFIWEFERACPDNLPASLPTNPNDKNWYIFDQPDEVVVYETELQKIYQPISKVWEKLKKNDKETYDKLKKMFNSMHAEEEEEEDKKEKKDKKEEEEENKEKEDSKNEDNKDEEDKKEDSKDADKEQEDKKDKTEDQEKDGKEEEDKENGKPPKAKKKRVKKTPTSQDDGDYHASKRLTEEYIKEALSVSSLRELYENTEELVYEYKFKREGLAVAPYEIIFDKEVLQDLCLGYAWILKAEEGFELGRYIRTDNKKIRKIRRYDHYKTAGYEEDPYSKKGRIKARINSESSSKTEDVENYKENFFLFGINAYNQRSNIFKNRISTEMIISDSNQFKRIIENLASVPIQIDSAGEIG